MDATPASATPTPAAAAPVDPAAALAAVAKPTPAAPAPAAAAPGASADDVMKERVAAIAKERDELQRERDTHKERLTKAEKAEKAEALAKEGKYLEACELMGWDPDDAYLKFTDQVNAREKAKKDPEAVARKLIEDNETKKQTEARESAEKNWTSAARAEMGKSFDAFPDVGRAIAEGKISYDDLIKVAYAEQAQGRSTAPADILKKAQEAIKPPAAAAAAGDKKETPAATAAPAAAPGSTVPVSKPAGEEDLSVDEAFERAKAKHFKR